MKKNKYRIIGIDFDGTLAITKGSYPRIQKPIPEVIDYIKEEQKNGAYIILITMREGKNLEDAVEWSREQGLEFDAVNDNLDFMKEFFHDNPRKIFCNEYIDNTNMGRYRIYIRRNKKEKRMKDLLLMGFMIIFIYGSYDIFNRIIFPKLFEHGLKEIERNPRWITSELNYYGFEDIDIVVAESKFGALPYFRLGEKNQLELWIPYNTSTKDAVDVGRLALAGKIKAKYGLDFFNKPLYWLSTLCYMLDGGDVKVPEYERKDNKPID